MTKEMFIETANQLAAFVHNNAVSKGWWDAPRNDGELLALVHSEVSEALEALREGNPASDKIPGFSEVEEELADVCIRIMDMAVKRGWRVPEAIVAKIEFNTERPYRHGKKF